MPSTGDREPYARRRQRRLDDGLCIGGRALPGQPSEESPHCFRQQNPKCVCFPGAFFHFASPIGEYALFPILFHRPFRCLFCGFSLFHIQKSLFQGKPVSVQRMVSGGGIFKFVLYPCLGWEIVYNIMCLIRLQKANSLLSNQQREVFLKRSRGPGCRRPAPSASSAIHSDCQSF